MLLGWIDTGMSNKHFETKYGIGDTLYAPRCYKVRKTDVIEVDGKAYVHSYEELEPVVKKKVVTGIHAIVQLDGTVRARYAMDEEEYTLRPESYLDKMHPTLQCAQAIAQKAFDDGVEYFG